MASGIRVLATADVAEKLSVHRTTVYRIAKDDPDFPRPIRIYGRTKGWREDEIDRWLRERPRFDEDA